jgi:hypothetical protein
MSLEALERPEVMLTTRHLANFCALPHATMKAELKERGVPATPRVNVWDLCGRWPSLFRGLVHSHRNVDVEAVSDDPYAAHRSGMPSGPGVYFVVSMELRLVKIGRSRAVHNRVAALKASIPGRLWLLGFIPNPRLERRLHRRFEYQRERGEWFRQGPDLLAFAFDHEWPRPTPGLPAEAAPSPPRSRLGHPARP